MKKFITYIILICLSVQTQAQVITKTEPNQFEILQNGDTINRTDENGNRVGYWSIYHPGRYGDDPYYEVGNFNNNKKHGGWKSYAKNGFVREEINYFNNYKNGEAKFYDRGRLICIGQYKALRTDAAYDTIQVEDPVTNLYKSKIVPTSLGSVRHGFWVYYKPPFNEIKRIEEWSVDDLIYEKDYVTKTDSLYIQKRLSAYPHTSGKLPKGFWSKDKGRAPVRFTDFPENVKYVKPNVRKKK